jgi:hypothetical protein
MNVSGVPSSTNKVYLWVYADCPTAAGRYSVYYLTGTPTCSEGAVENVITSVTTGSITASGG